MTKRLYATDWCEWIGRQKQDESDDDFLNRVVQMECNQDGSDVVFWRGKRIIGIALCHAVGGRIIRLDGTRSAEDVIEQAMKEYGP